MEGILSMKLIEIYESKKKSKHKKFNCDLVDKPCVMKSAGKFKNKLTNGMLIKSDN